MRMSIRMCCGITLAVLSAASCSDDDDPVGPGSFLLAVTPLTRVTAPGTTTFVTVQLQRNGLFNGPVALSISNTPAGVSASMDPAVFSGSTVESRVNLTVAPTAPLGTATISLKGTADLTEYTVTFTLTIAAPN